MIEYTKEEAKDFYLKLVGEQKIGDNFDDKNSPREIILRALRIECIFTSDEAWNEDLKDRISEYVFIKPIEEMPLLINELPIIQFIASWRLSVAK